MMHGDNRLQELWVTRFLDNDDKKNMIFHYCFGLKPRFGIKIGQESMENNFAEFYDSIKPSFKLHQDGFTKQSHQSQHTTRIIHIQVMFLFIALLLIHLK